MQSTDIITNNNIYALNIYSHQKQHISTQHIVHFQRKALKFSKKNQV